MAKRKWYGSLTNRVEENQKFVKEITVGEGVTEYLWSDRKPYEVTKVIDQTHIFIRPMDYKRTDNNGMSECQDYEYFSNESYKEIELKFKYNHWYRVERWTDPDGKKRWKSEKMNISIGVMERYYDYSF